MISEIKVKNRFYMDILYGGLKAPPFKIWNLISISCPDTDLQKNVFLTDICKGKMMALGCKNMMALAFDDVTESSKDKCHNMGYCTTIFNEDHAKQIIDFAHSLQFDLEKMPIVIHCDAGISRSGAVATFISDYFHIPFKDELIRPNSYVLNVLWKVADEMKSDSKKIITSIKRDIEIILP